MKKDIKKEILGTNNPGDRFLSKQKYTKNQKNSKNREDYWEKQWESSKSYKSTVSGINFSYIRRYLLSNVGKPWNQVWSEICKTFDGKYTGMRRWFLYQVYNNGIEISFPKVESTRFIRSHFYVDEEGILKYFQKKSRKKKKAS